MLTSGFFPQTTAPLLLLPALVRFPQNCSLKIVDMLSLMGLIPPIKGTAKRIWSSAIDGQKDAVSMLTNRATLKT